MSTEYSLEEVARHNTRDDLWVVIDDNVYDLTKFARLHPGGRFPLVEVAGKDATTAFYGLHRADLLAQKRYQRMIVGKLKGGRPASKPSADAPVPYGESHGFWRKFSPYYKETHHKFRAAVRDFVDRELRPDAAKIDEKGGDCSLEKNQKMGQFGILAAGMASHKKVLGALGFTSLPGGVTLDEFDEFHELILAEEVKRLGTYGYCDGLIGGFSIGLPPILNFGSKDLISRVAPSVLSGDKRIALCISEPYAGSDVSKIHTVAQKSADGSHWIVNGVKKWITGGRYADYFTTLCNTDKGMVLLCVERGEGLETKEIKTSYSKAAGTAYVTYDDVKVPMANTIGKVGHGFLYAMHNFNKERWGMVAAGNRMSRLMVEECMKWATQREIFGKRLIDQAVIRFKLAQMASEVEVVHSCLEDLTYQMTMMSEKEINKHLAGPIALLKFKQTRAATLVSDNACQIFGGRALTRTGMGQFVEKFQRSFKMQGILGGSEEIMADFAIRQAMKRGKEGLAAKL